MQETLSPKVQLGTTPNFYREFLAERDEILKNKWVLSEKTGYDVGFDVALIDWVMHHRERWIAAREERLRRGN